MEEEGIMNKLIVHQEPYRKKINKVVIGTSDSNYQKIISEKFDLSRKEAQQSIAAKKNENRYKTFTSNVEVRHKRKSL